METPRNIQEIFMVSQKSKVMQMIICLLAGILIGIGIKTIAIMIEKNKQTETSQQIPERSITVAIKKGQQVELFNQFQKFSDDQGFAIRIAPTTPGGEDFMVQMWRQDVKVLALNSFDPEVFTIYFSDTDRVSPAHEWVYSDLVNDIKSYIIEIPNVIISDGK
jgi:hypothetical protein